MGTVVNLPYSEKQHYYVLKAVTCNLCMPEPSQSCSVTKHLAPDRIFSFPLISLAMLKPMKK